MTVIACRDGVMAADTASWNGAVVRGNATKIVRLRDGSLFGAAGWKPVILRAREWLIGGGERPAAADSDDLDGIVLRRDGSIWIVTYKFDLYPSDAEMAVAGAHDDFLLGAMLAGASAEEAVRLAVAHCSGARGNIQVERL